jgi:hypothetical protein
VHKYDHTHMTLPCFAAFLAYLAFLASVVPSAGCLTWGLCIRRPTLTAAAAATTVAVVRPSLGIVLH